MDFHMIGAHYGLDSGRSERNCHCKWQPWRRTSSSILFSGRGGIKSSNLLKFIVGLFFDCDFCEIRKKVYLCAIELQQSRSFERLEILNQKFNLSHITICKN